MKVRLTQDCEHGEKGKVLTIDDEKAEAFAAEGRSEPYVEPTAGIITPPPGTPVGALLAQGQVALGFQQLSELIHVPGIRIVGPWKDSPGWRARWEAQQRGEPVPDVSLPVGFVQSLAARR